MLPTVTATAYLTPLREGGSLPGIVEADDLGTYVVKFTGAGQGTKALVAEIVVGELGRRLGVAIPELALIEVDPEIGRREPDQEVQELVASSAGLNLAVDFLPGAVGYDRSFVIDRSVADRVVWLDAFVANVDRSARNTNLLIWHKSLWAIDHGACLRFHHAWGRRDGFATSRTTTAITCSEGSVDRRRCTNSSPARSPRSCWPRSWRAFPTPGCCPTRTGRIRRLRRLPPRRERRTWSICAPGSTAADRWLP